MTKPDLCKDAQEYFDSLSYIHDRVESSTYHHLSNKWQCNSDFTRDDIIQLFGIVENVRTSSHRALSGKKRANDPARELFIVKFKDKYNMHSYQSYAGELTFELKDTQNAYEIFRQGYYT